MLKQIIVGSILASAFLSSAHAEQTFTQATHIKNTVGTVSIGTIKSAKLLTDTKDTKFKSGTLITGGLISHGTIKSGAITGGSIDAVDIKPDKKTNETTVGTVSKTTLIEANLTDVKGTLVNKEGEGISVSDTPVILEGVELTDATIQNVTVAIDTFDADSKKVKNLAPNPSDFFTPGAWGAGLGMILNEQPVVSSASIVNSTTVRADSIQYSQPELVLTRHYYNASRNNECKGGVGSMTVFDSQTCVGGFIAVGISSSSQLIDMFGVGILFGFGKVHEKGADGLLHENTQLRQHNFGIGIGRRFGVKQLGDGFANNAPPPTGETQVRYKTVDIPGV